MMSSAQTGLTAHLVMLTEDPGDAIFIPNQYGVAL